MAIKINVLENAIDNIVDQGYSFKDLALDLSYTNITTSGFTQKILSNDIKVNYDIDAIKNSLLNLFNTLPGQRFLFPKYGLNLNQFLFLPITIETGDLIGNLIYRSLINFEPRVIPKLVKVTGDPENNEYRITLTIEIPVFNNTSNLNFALNTKSRSFLLI